MYYKVPECLPAYIRDRYILGRCAVVVMVRNARIYILTLAAAVFRKEDIEVCVNESRIRWREVLGVSVACEGIYICKYGDSCSLALEGD